LACGDAGAEQHAGEEFQEATGTGTGAPPTCPRAPLPLSQAAKSDEAASLMMLVVCVTVGPAKNCRDAELTMGVTATATAADLPALEFLLPPPVSPPGTSDADADANADSVSDSDEHEDEDEDGASTVCIVIGASTLLSCALSARFGGRGVSAPPGTPVK
jgi:hypothetical protein